MRSDARSSSTRSPTETSRPWRGGCTRPAGSTSRGVGGQPALCHGPGRCDGADQSPGHGATSGHEVGDDRWLFVLPGIPREFSTIVEEELIPNILRGGTAPVVREVRYRSVPESEMSEPMLVLAAEFPDVTVGSYPQLSDDNSSSACTGAKQIAWTRQ